MNNIVTIALSRRLLTITSLQNSSSFKSSDVSAGGSATFGFGGSFSANASASKINSNFQSVGTQSGIRAGDGGFEVNVKGTTALTGGVISSTQAAVDKGLNSFNGNTAEGISRLTLTDISNQAEFKAQSVSISTSGGGAGSMSDKSASTSQSGISGIAGNQATRTGEKEAGLVQIFDKDKVTKDIQAQVTITTAFGQNASKAIGDYGASKTAPIDQANQYQALKAREGSLNKQEQEALGKLELAGYTPDKAAADLKNPQNIADFNAWKEGGVNRVAAHALVGGITGGVNGALGAATSQTVIPILGEEVAKLDIPVDLKKVLIQTASLAIGVATGGVNGAVSAHNATTNNYLTHTELKSRAQSESACKQGDAKACQAVRDLDQKSVDRNMIIETGITNATVAQKLQIQSDIGSTVKGLYASKGELQLQLEAVSDPQERAILQLQINKVENNIQQAAGLSKTNLLLLYQQTGDETYNRAYAQLQAATSGNELGSTLTAIALQAASKGKNATAGTLSSDEVATYALQRNGWKKPDGSQWYPPNNGAILGSETQAVLPVGTPVNRFGGTGKDSSYLSPQETPPGARSLVPGTDTTLVDTYIVLKPLPVEKSIIAPTYGQPGLGTQYNTKGGTGMSIEQLVREGFLIRIAKP